MRLYRIFPNRVVFPIDGHPSDVELSARAIAAVMIYLERWLEKIGEIYWRVSYKEINCQSQDLTGELFDRSQALDLLRSGFDGDIFVVLRDLSCRFVRSGQDWDIIICLKHDDPELEMEDRLVEVTDISTWLIETDSFDI